MLEYRENQAEKIIELDIGGSIDEEQVKSFVKNVTPRIEEWGQVKLLQRIKDVPSISPGAIYEDVKFLLKNTTGFGRCALVVDNRIIQEITKAINIVTPNEIKTFEDEIAARQWLLAAD